jgi:hypothetical protein
MIEQHMFVSDLEKSMGGVSLRDPAGESGRVEGFSMGAGLDFLALVYVVERSRLAMPGTF